VVVEAFLAHEVLDRRLLVGEQVRDLERAAVQRAEVPWGRKTDARTAGGVATQTTSYSYDALGRLSHVGLPSGVSRDYGYDLDSNRTA
jgi:YD repeat-containing protein